MPSATKPKSPGVNRRTRTTVLTMPRPRLANRHTISQPAPCSVRAASERTGAVLVKDDPDRADSASFRPGLAVPS